MKSFSNLITESIALPEFSHPDLNKPRDPDGKFWKAIEAANEKSDRSSKGSYDKAIKAAKALYALLVELDDDKNVVAARDHVSNATKALEAASGDTIEEFSATDVRQLKQYIYLIKSIDSTLRHKPFYKKGHVDMKAGYVPFRGASKDPKVKYRMVIHSPEGISVNAIKDIRKDIGALNPLASDYICGIEFNKDNSAVQILFTNSPGYRR